VIISLGRQQAFAVFSGKIFLRQNWERESRVGVTLMGVRLFQTRQIPCQLYLHVVNLYTLILNLASQFIYIDDGDDHCHTLNCSISFLFS